VKKRFLILLACGAVLGLLIVSGLSCVSYIFFHENPTTGYELPTTGAEFQSYVTPECPWVVGTLQGILGAPPYGLSQAGFDDIRDWIADDNNIKYKSDEERWGEDYWQTPEETLTYYTGDCEDFSTLLCSLLRAYGIGAERVYVALGVEGNDEEPGHAFLIENWYQDGEWRRIESQSSSHYPDLNFGLDKYEIAAAFNDLYYYDESFPWDED
jgi:hypothetical protein